MLPTAKQMPKMEARFFPAIWLGKDTSTSENILGISNKVVRSRATRRQIKPDKYNKQLLDVINNAPMTTRTASNFITLPAAKMVARPQTTTGHRQCQHSTKHVNQSQHTHSNAQRTTASHHRQMVRTPLPMPTSKRDVADDMAEGSASKQQRTSKEQAAPAGPETRQEPPATSTESQQ